MTSSSGWPRPGSRSRAGTTAPASRPTTGWPGSRSGGSSPRATPSASGTDPRSPSTGPPPWGATASGWGSSGPGSSPTRHGVDRSPWPATPPSSQGCLDRGLEPLVTLHHFTHPAWLGDDFWLRPDAPDRYRAWVELAVEALAPWVRHWVTINEINVLAMGSWLLGMFPPGRPLGLRGRRHRHRPPAGRPRARLRGHPPGPARRRRHHQQLLPERLRLRPPCSSTCCWPAAWAWSGPRSTSGWPSAAASTTPASPRSAGRARRPRVQRGHGRRTGVGRRPWPAPHRSEPAPGPVRRRAAPVPRRAVEAVYDSPHERTLDVLGLDYYDPMAARHFRLPGPPHRRRPQPPPDPGAVGRRPRSRPASPGGCEVQHALAPGPAAVGGGERAVQPGPPTVARYPRLDGWDRPRYLREHIGAVMAAVDAGVPVAGLLALVAGRQLRVGLVRAPLRPLRRGPPPRRARDALAGDRRAGRRRRRRLPPDHRRAAGRRPVGARPG